jgi:hypothetical protein
MEKGRLSLGELLGAALGMGKTSSKKFGYHKGDKKLDSPATRMSPAENGFASLPEAVVMHGVRHLALNVLDMIVGR